LLTKRLICWRCVQIRQTEIERRFRDIEERLNVLETPKDIKLEIKSPQETEHIEDIKPKEVPKKIEKTIDKFRSDKK